MKEKRGQGDASSTNHLHLKVWGFCLSWVGAPPFPFFLGAPKRHKQRPLTPATQVAAPLFSLHPLVVTAAGMLLLLLLLLQVREEAAAAALFVGKGPPLSLVAV